MSKKEKRALLKSLLKGEEGYEEEDGEGDGEGGEEEEEGESGEEEVSLDNV